MRNVQSGLLGLALLVAIESLVAQTPTSTIFNPAPSRIVGQAILQQQGVLTASAPNLVEGREFNGPQGIALDTSVSPPILYVADVGNNRVLAWKNALSFTKGDFADKAIGQRDLISTAPQGPGTNLSTGLSAPVGVAVDKNGNLYVLDEGNNRILRYPKPLAQTGDLLPVDLIIGQKDSSGRSSNEGQQFPNERTLSFSPGGQLFRGGIAFDPQGNLWISDPGNNRVLRFPASALDVGATNEPAANLVLGQSDFTSNTLPQGIDQSPCGATKVVGRICAKNFLNHPSGLAFDTKGRLFVADDQGRVLVFVPPFLSGQFAARIMGVVFPTLTNQNPLRVSDTTLGVPQGVFFLGDKPFVVDNTDARILGYDSFDQWPDENAVDGTISPAAKVVVGQASFQAFNSNRGLAQPNASSLAGPQPSSNVQGPVAGVFLGTDMYVVDTGNNRVLVFPQQPGGQYLSANRLLGQLDFQYNSLNLIEGREFGFNGNINSCVVNGQFAFGLGGSVVIDTSSDPPHMYVSDPLNNRVLGYRDYRKVNAGTMADIVIGQPDLRTAVINYPGNSPTQTNDQGLWSPEGLAIDANGNLYVADACNARVLRFSKPSFDAPQVLPHANLFLGQTGYFGQPIKDVSRQTMRSSYGLAFTADGSLVVSDPLANRILYFKKPAGGDFSPGASATNVFGQPDFSSSLVNVFSGPHLIAIDPDDQLYIADTGFNRIAILPNVPSAGDNPPIFFSISSLGQPYGVVVNQVTDEIWVTNTTSNQLLRFPRFEKTIVNPVPSASLVVFAPIAVALDPFGNPVAAEALLNRVSFYFPAIDSTGAAGGLPGRFSGNGANYFQRFAPAMLASIFPYSNSRFGDKTEQAAGIPLPTILGDVQVFVGGVAAPLLYASSSQINLQIPSATPAGSFQEFQVVRASTGQILASWLFRIDSGSPGLFTANATGAGQLAATNADGTPNDGTHPAKAGTFITLYGTGQGLVDGLPPDGQPNPPGEHPTAARPRVFINADFVPDSDVQYSGLAPGFVGLWQINVKIPANAPPADVSVFVQFQGLVSSQDQFGTVRRTTIRTSP